MTSKVFISYRREDSAGYAGRVRDRLASELGRDLLFMDVDGIPLGVNFVKVLQEEVAKCSVLLAVIGRDWLDVRDEQGRRRLDAPDDWVRVEIAAALQRNIPVIPILLEGTQVPKRDQLPDDMRELAVRSGLAVHHASFHSDMDILIRSLRARLAGADGQGAPSPTAGVDLDGAQAPSPRSTVQLPPRDIVRPWLRNNMVVLTGLVVAVVIAAAGFVWSVTASQKSAGNVTTSGPQSPVVQGTKGDVRIDFNPPQPSPR